MGVIQRDMLICSLEMDAIITRLISANGTLEEWRGAGRHPLLMGAAQCHMPLCSLQADATIILSISANWTLEER